MSETRLTTPAEVARWIKEMDEESSASERDDEHADFPTDENVGESGLMPEHAPIPPNKQQPRSNRSRSPAHARSIDPARRAADSPTLPRPILPSLKDAKDLSRWLLRDVGIYEAEVTDVLFCLAAEDITTLAELRSRGLARGGAVVSEDDPAERALRPIQRLQIVQQLSYEAKQQASAAFWVWFWASSTITFFGTLHVLFGLLAYRKLGDALVECCGVPRISLLQRLAGWLWAAENAGPALVTVLLLWWSLLLLGLWRTVPPRRSPVSRVALYLPPCPATPTSPQPHPNLTHSESCPALRPSLSLSRACITRVSPSVHQVSSHF